MSQVDDVARLERDYADVMQRMFAVGTGLARLRSDLERAAAAAPSPALGGATAQGPVARPSPAVPRVSPPAAATPPAAAMPPVAGPALPRVAGPASPPPPTWSPVPPGAVPPRVPWYRRDGAVTRVLAVAGAVVTLSGIAMLLVIAVRAGWFGPEARVLAGAALAVVLGGLGARGGARDRVLERPVGSAPVALVATGAAAAYLDVVAVTALYGWLPPAVGLLLAVAVAGVGLSLARRWESELLAVLMVSGAAVLSPAVAGRPGWLLSGMLAVLALAGWWAQGGRSMPRLTIVRTTPVALSVVAGAVVETRAGALAALLAVAAVVLLATLVTSAVDARRHPPAPTVTVGLTLAAVAALAVTGALEDPWRTVSVAVLAAVLLLAATVYGRAPVGPLPTHLTGATAAVLAVVSGAPDGFTGTGLLLLALGYVAAGGVTRSRLHLALGAAVSVLGLLVWVIHPVAMLTIALAERHDLAVAFVDSGLVVALVALLTWAATTLRGVPEAVRRSVRIGSVAVALVAGLTMLVALGTLAGLRFGEVELGFTAGHAVGTIAWMVVAAGLLLRSLDGQGSDHALRWGLALSAVAVAKLFLFDLAALDGVVRSVAFIVTGLLLLATGSRYARAWERRRVGT